MSQGVYVPRGTDVLISAMKTELNDNGVDIRNYAEVEEVLVDDGEGAPKVCGVVVNGVKVVGRTVVSNANLKTTVTKFVDRAYWRPNSWPKPEAVRMNIVESVYLGIRKARLCRTWAICSSRVVRPSSILTRSVRSSARAARLRSITPEIRLGSGPLYGGGVDELRYEDWVNMSDETYSATKTQYASDTIAALEGYVPDIRAKIDHVEVGHAEDVRVLHASRGGHVVWDEVRRA